MTHNLSFQRIVFILALSISLLSCKKHTDIIPVNPSGNNSSSTFNTTITGIVKDIAGNPLSGVIISAYAKTAVTGDYGEFIIKDVTVDDRVYVKAEKQGYFTGTATEVTSNSGKNDITNVHITLAEKSTTATLNFSSGGTAQDANGNSVVIPAEGVVTAGGGSYSGDINVSILHLDPTTPSFGLLTQGNDMSAINTAGEYGTLYSYGVLKVELSDASDNKLQLAPGKTATITLKIPSAQLTSAPSTIPLWYFDEEKGRWIEEGIATKTGDSYVGTVSHFTDWNCDVLSPSIATITGKVVDCSGKPVPFIVVITGQTSTFTDQNGVYTRRVPAGSSIEVKAVSFLYQNYSSVETISIPVLSESQTYHVPDLVLNECVFTVNGTLVVCDQSPASGYVLVNGNTLAFVENGTFSIITSTKDPVTIFASNFSTGFVAENAVYPASSNTANVGNLIACTEMNSENSFVMNGEGFTNEQVTLIPYENIISYCALWDVGSGQGSIPQEALVIYSRGLAGDVALAIEGEANTLGLGVYPLVKYTPVGGMPSYINLSNLTEDLYYAESGTITITKYSNVGGLVEGTYSGTYRNHDFNTGLPGSKVITITEGKFTALRYPNRP